MTAVDEIKERLNIVEFISAYVPLRKAGHNYQGLCPFHNEKTPSFVVFPDTQSWHCFGACGTGGDAFTFLMRRENIDFPEAVRQLAGRLGITLQRSEQEAAASDARNLLIAINEQAATFYNRLLLDAPQAEPARAYLARRHITTETIRAFQLGYAPAEWHTLEGYLTAQGYRLADALSAGLLTERDEGGYYDRFRGRLMFPIRNARGQVVGFGGRVLDDGVPKYLNSPQTAVFDKSHNLYGIDLAKEAIRDAGMAVIVEGYMDVLMAHQHGIRNVVASLGTALTEAHLDLLKRLAKTFALALDSDAAGGRGTLRGLETARQVMEQQVLPVPTAQGKISYEAQLGVELKIITLPPGKDPDEVIHEDPAAWARLVQDALPIVEYYFRALTADLDLDSPKGKGEAVNRLRPIIAEIGNPTERAHYIQRLAHLVRLEERQVASEMRNATPRTPSRVTRKVGRFSGPPGLILEGERYLLFLLMYDPTLLRTMNDILSRLRLEPLTGDDFQTEYREIFSFLASKSQSGEPFHLEDVNLPGEPVWESLSQEGQAFQERIKTLSEADLSLATTRALLKLRQQRLERRLLELRYLNEDAQQSGDQDARRRWGAQVALCSIAKGRLDEALRRITVLGYKKQERPDAR